MVRVALGWLVACLVFPVLAGAELGALRIDTPPFEVSADDLAQRVHALVNAERKKARLPLLAWNGALAAIALDHSRDMAGRSYFSHHDPEGHDFDWRYRQAGFECQVRAGKFIHARAENLALSRLYNSYHRVKGGTTYDWNTPAAIAHKTVDGWMRSPSHRANILAAHWRQQGIGVVIAAENRILITQNFC